MIDCTHQNKTVMSHTDNILFYVSQDRTPGEVFVPKSSKEAEMEKILKSMEVIVLSLVQSICHTILVFC